MKVDLPEPFWPSSPCTSPGRTSRSTSCRTFLLAKVFEKPLADRAGVCCRSSPLTSLDAPELLVGRDVVHLSVPGGLLGVQVDRADVRLGEQPVQDPDVRQGLVPGGDAEALVGQRPALQQV